MVYCALQEELEEVLFDILGSEGYGDEYVQRYQVGTPSGWARCDDATASPLVDHAKCAWVLQMSGSLVHSHAFFSAPGRAELAPILLRW